MTTSERRTCPICHRLARPRNRFCSAHSNRNYRYGDPTAMPLTYRTHVAPRFRRWVADGYRRLHDHPAMQAGRELAERCLAFTYVPDSDAIRVQSWIEAARMMEALRHAGVTAEQLMLRTAELFALFDAEPTRCRNRAAEDMALGKAVMHLVQWSGKGRGQSKALALATAAHIREHLGSWAMAFARKLQADQGKLDAVKERAATFD